MEKIEIAEVLNEMMKRACDFEKPKVTMTASTSTTTAATTTAYRKPMVVEEKAKDETEKELDQVMAEPVVIEAAYPNLVSINKTDSQKYATKMIRALGALI